VYLQACPSLAPRPKYQASQGAIVETLGIPLTSHWSATGLVTSGVEEATTRSTWSLLISSLVTSVARVALDWESFTTISIVRFLPPAVKPLASESCTVLTMTLSAAAKLASGPVCGLT